MLSKTVAELAIALANKDVSSVELTQAYLDRIAQLNPTLNAYVTTTPDQALAQAAAADALRAAGKAGPLTGIPIAHKDIFCTRDVLTACGSRMLAEDRSHCSCRIVPRPEERARSADSSRTPRPYGHTAWCLASMARVGQGALEGVGTWWHGRTSTLER